MTLQDFLTQVGVIAQEKPVYHLGGDGSGGQCDCIGLVIGACRRCGIRWKGIHGSNWSARNATEDIRRIVSAGELSLGDLVYKARTPSSSRYALPARYNVHFDDKDYYHIGVVTQLNPLRITHCTSPDGITVDKKLEQWKYHGRLNLITGNTPALPTTIRYGSRGDAVAQLQLLLREQGFNLQPDGIFGPMTQEALRSYQSSRGLEADGIAGPKTWTSLLT